jgi:hypothetical protein
MIRKMEEKKNIVNIMKENIGKKRSEVERMSGKISECGSDEDEVERGLKKDLDDMRVNVKKEKDQFGKMKYKMLKILGKKYEDEMEDEKLIRKEKLKRINVENEIEMD